MDMWMIVALLGLVIILYASMLPRTPERKPVQEDFLDSVGDTLQQFAEEIESENKELIRMVGEMKREHEQRTGKLLARIEQLEKHSAASEERRPPAAPPQSATATPAAAPRPFAAGVAPELPPPPLRTDRLRPESVTHAAAESRPTPVDAAAPRDPDLEDKPVPEPASRFADTVKSRYKELFDLHDSGKSIEHIAKKLGKNKGEVQLIIGLAKQEEPQHGQP
ncbi:hypothetical protein FE782_22720 [Paenibacillus antri]|uniref:Uncharacterized protein n=1 Tax=Paenibacillus antri TaxID=2582848 RepID=A0A5R9G0I8_9BACL|nr:hypothetical protein [Paenibacillus antri]TLS49822.1 hypothetical protein FE782_22720 [Paenibacillus antri]